MKKVTIMLGLVGAAAAALAATGIIHRNRRSVEQPELQEDIERFEDEGGLTIG